MYISIQYPKNPANNHGARQLWPSPLHYLCTNDLASPLFEGMQWGLV